MTLIERDLLPLYERQAARAAIEQIVERLGSQAAAGAALGCSQQAVNKAVVYTKVGPSIMRSLLEYTRLDIRELLARYGDPTTMPADAATPQSIKEMAIDAGVKYGGGANERDVRALADKYEPVLKDEPVGVWVETLLREIRATITRPRMEQRAHERSVRSHQRMVRRRHGAKQDAAATPATSTAQGRSTKAQR
jgi:hypothetical protein